MSVWIEGRRGFYLGAQAFVLDEDRELAWAEKFILKNPAHRWILGRYVEADRPNSNRQLFPLEELQAQRPTITHAPMNLNHHPHRIVGAYVATEMVYPTQQAAHDCPKCGEEMKDGRCSACGYDSGQAAAAPQNPFIDALGVFWKHYFPEEFRAVEAAHKMGHLFYSMECVPQQIACAGPSGCGAEFAYDGRQSEKYCEHLRASTSDKKLIKPHFTAGAILLPPVQPGWSNAEIHKLVANHAEAAEDIYEGVKREAPHLDAHLWESLMHSLLVTAEGR